MNEEKIYLGDGAYAKFDGFGIWVTAEDGVRIMERVYLEPHAWRALKSFAERTIEK